MARIALERAVELQTGYAEAWAALAIVVIDEDGMPSTPGRTHSTARWVQLSALSISIPPV